MIENVNIFNVISSLLVIARAEFYDLSENAQTTAIETQIAENLYRKIAKITRSYKVIDEYENDFDTTGSFTATASAESQASSCNSSGSEFDPENFQASKPEVTIKQKAKVLDYIKQNPTHGFKTINRRFSYFKYPYYAERWKAQVQNGGTREENLYEVEKFTIKSFTEARNEGKPVHDIDIKRWAIQRASEYAGLRNNFTASASWVLSFKNKYRITSRKITKIISRREAIKMEEILKEAESFRQEILELERSYDHHFIWNTDQVGFCYEYINERTLSWKGEEITFATGFSPKNAATHSYTTQFIISAAGEIIGKPLLCLKESTGDFGVRVEKTMFKPPNLIVTSTKSGKLRKKEADFYFRENALQLAKGKVLYILDSWSGHLNLKSYQKIPKDKQINFKVIPKNCTPYVQPLDVYFNREYKYLVKEMYNHAYLHNIRLTSRDCIIKIQSLAAFILSSPVFCNAIKYSWRKSGLVETEKEYFLNVRDACYNITTQQCNAQECAKFGFIKCPWCNQILCFGHLFFEFHVTQCTHGPYTI